MKKYHQISYNERVKIQFYLKSGLSIRKIALELGRNPASISRELKRNRGIEQEQYCPDIAFSFLYKRRLLRLKILANPKLLGNILQYLENYWSPEQISGRMIFEKRKNRLCHQTIYNFLKRSFNRELLPKKGKRYKYRYVKPEDFYNQINSIHQRPPIVEQKGRYGDWEVDLVISAGENKKNITTLIERKSRFVLAKINQTKRKEEVLKGIKDMMQPLTSRAKKSVTTDRGLEFMEPLYFEKQIGLQAFYCDKSSPWQKGSIENFNGRLRRFLPKKMSFENLEQSELDKIINIMNNTPRKCLNYQTPTEAFRLFNNNVLHLS